ncbi:GDSL-type esterase/lipase family protein [Chitinophaga sp. Cy-1792]|uniref:GDSL-type esterase/lipase family protein n=1 Tax=Chitinophaga sp. Cy-1792 TaxID=2608339 RepID=UPI001420F47A|nr:GDSL-type esterase/lipase family protein [Chitinophaga sp. Cy-1792]NIG56828.1 lipolytic protein G-D-S-L family [Chitinophaga sp. Cy-1792]
MKLYQTAALSCLLMAGGIAAKSQVASTKCNIVFVGNSITYGATLPFPATQCPPFHVIETLRARGYTLRYANCGHSGSTTVDFLPASRNLFPKVVAAADSLYNDSTPLIFSVTLGTNDSAIEGPTGAPVSPEDYQKNLKTIIDSLHSRYPRSIFVLQRPIWYSTNTYNGSKYLAEGLARLQTYTPELDRLAKENPAYILQGDRKAFDYFKKNADQYFTRENGKAGVFLLHPNVAGAEKLATFWAKNLQQVIESRYRNSVRKQSGR